jgi:hypothetical protein
MSDGLTAPPTPPPAAPSPELLESSGAPSRSAWVVAPLQALAILVVFAAAGAALGGLWYHLWDVPSGVVSGGQWYTNEAGLRDDFQGVALYVALSLVGGLVLGALAAWLLDRAELVTLLAVVAGSALAAYVMFRVGTHLSPADPHELAKSAADGTKLKGSLRVTSWPPRGAFSFGALVALSLVYAISVGRAPVTPNLPDREVDSGTRG